MGDDLESVAGNVSVVGEENEQWTVYYHPKRNPHLGVMFTNVQPEKGGKVNVDELEKLFGGLRNLMLVGSDGSEIKALEKDKSGVSKEVVWNGRRRSIHITGEQVRGGETPVAKTTVNNTSIEVDADYFSSKDEGDAANNPDAWRKSLRVFPAMTPSSDMATLNDADSSVPKCTGCGDYYGCEDLKGMCSMCCDDSTSLGKFLIKRRADAGFQRGSELMQKEKAEKFIAGIAIGVQPFKDLKKMVQSQLTWTPTLLSEALREFGNFMSCEQAKVLRDILHAKYTNEIDYRFHHALCSRVLDYWNLGIYGGIGECYYGSDEHKHVNYDVTPNGANLTKLMRRLKSQAHSFAETTLFDDDFVNFLAKHLEKDTGK